MPQTVLIVDDAEGVRETFPALLKLEGFQAATAADAATGIALAVANRFDAILVDLHLPHVSGIEFVKQVRQRGVRAPIVVFTAFPDWDCDAPAAREAGAVRYVEGPLLGDEVAAVVREALSASRRDDQAAESSPPPEGGPATAHPGVDHRICDVVRMLLNDPGLSAEALARRVNLSESRLRHLFTIDLGVSLVRFERFLRLNLAARLLRATYDGIGQIADRVGLPNLRRTFRTRFGMSPQVYRARYQAERDKQR